MKYKIILNKFEFEMNFERGKNKLPHPTSKKTRIADRK